MSVSGVSANERAGTLPSQRQLREGAAPAAQPSGAAPRSGPASLTPVGYTPPLGALRSDPTVIRIWVAPWQDADGDLVDQAYLYLQIDSGRWLIQHNREQIQRAFAPRSALSTAAASTATQALAGAGPSMAPAVRHGTAATAAVSAPPAIAAPGAAQ